jgi:serine/threonine protein kinase
MSLAPNTKLGPYEITSPLGAGGMGEVYRAKDTRLDRDVAIKVLPECLANDADALARFEREAKAVAALSHPNILAIHDVGHVHGISFVVTELLEGETLRERLRRSAIPWRKAVEQVIAIADGLSAAHAKGVIHRDLKPENIFLTTAGHVKILDFGLKRGWNPKARSPPATSLTARRLTLATRPGMILEHAQLHVPGTGPRSLHRRAQRHLLTRLRRLRNGRGTSSVCGGHARRHHDRHPQGGTGRHHGRAYGN